jgi:signal transduction histidine kinase
MSAGRLRLVLVLLAIALVVPSALLVNRALRGAEAESAARHQAVAERLFDEMERTLTDLVTREEARPVEAWRASDGARLAELPPEPFVLAYFQVEPDGRVTTPLAPRSERALRAATRWFASREDEGRVAEPKRSAEVAQAPGTTIALEENALGKNETAGVRAQGSVAKEQKAPAAPSKDAYDALQSLNRGFAERMTRQRKLVEEPAEADAEAPLAMRDEPQPMRQVAVDPMVGRLADPQHLLLYRGVFENAEALRQGLVLDVDALAGHLRERVLGANRIPGAVLSFASQIAAGDAVAPSGAHVYRHRFGEPFDAVTASVALAPLGRGGEAGTVYGLAVLLALTGIGGLFAVHRTVTVAMAYAERRSNFVAAVTHELKTPLTAIRMYGEMLRDGLVPNDAKRQEYYGTITAESERLSRLIDNVLEFSRLEKGTREMRLVVGPLGPVVDEVAALLRPHAEREGFTLRADVEPDLPPVRFERDALFQVLLNLVDNAIKYARGASIRDVTIEVRRHGPGVSIAVRDHGPGVAPRHLVRIFEPFHRGEDELVRTTQGTGLGLALVESLVARMGGTVAGRNASGGGFEVRVELPAV